MELKINRDKAESSGTHPDAEDFELMMRSFCIEARRFGKHLTPTTSDFEKFRSLPNFKKQEIIKTFSTYYKMLLRAVGDGIDLQDSLSTAWWAIRELGLRPPSELFAHLS